MARVQKLAAITQQLDFDSVACVADSLRSALFVNRDLESRRSLRQKSDGHLNLKLGPVVAVIIAFRVR